MKDAGKDAARWPMAWASPEGAATANDAAAAAATAVSEDADGRTSRPRNTTRTLLESMSSKPVMIRMCLASPKPSQVSYETEDIVWEGGVCSC